MLSSFRLFHASSGRALRWTSYLIPLLPWLALGIFLLNRNATLGVLMMYGVFALAIIAVTLGILILRDMTAWGRAGGYDALRSTKISSLQIVLAELANALLIVTFLALSVLLILWLGNSFSNMALTFNLVVIAVWTLALVLALLLTRAILLRFPELPVTVLYLIVGSIIMQSSRFANHFPFFSLACHLVLVALLLWWNSHETGKQYHAG